MIFRDRTDAGERLAAVLQRYRDQDRTIVLGIPRGGVVVAKAVAVDLHLPLGCGTVDVRNGIEALKRCGYDGTITLEVFTPDRHYLEYSRDRLRQLWEQDRSAHKAS